LANEGLEQLEIGADSVADEKWDAGCRTARSPRHAQNLPLHLDALNRVERAATELGLRSGHV
jgi:hypothetical protein